MTEKDFWKIVDSIDVDSRADGRYTEDEMYTIGCEFIKLNNSEKRKIGGWDKLVEILQPLDKNGNIMTKGDTFRQWIKGHRYSNNDMIHNEHMLSGKNIEDMSFKDFEEKTEKIKQSLYKQQVKTRDTLNEYRKTLRSDARIESMVDSIHSAIINLKDLPEVSPAKVQRSKTNIEMVVCFSDLHLGDEVNNSYNYYNEEIARNRVSKYIDDIIYYARLYNIQTLHFLSLGDAISGLIHPTLRYSQELNVVEQVTKASEIIANALNKLQEAAPEVIYYDVLDNHSRLTPAKDEAIELENFSKIITWYLEERLKNTKIKFAHNNIDPDIGMLTLKNGKLCMFAHGHLERKNTVVQDFVGLTHQFPDYIFLAHFHSPSQHSFQGSKVYINGSIMGTDDYSYGRRLFGKPEQKIVIFHGDNVVDIDISLDDSK